MCLPQAALCAIRIVDKLPEMCSDFAERAVSLLSAQHHGVLLAGASLMFHMCQLDAKVVRKLRKVRWAASVSLGVRRRPCRARRACARWCRC